MDDTLKLHLLNAMFRLRKIAFGFPPCLDVNMGELMFLRKIAEHTATPAHAFAIAHIHQKLHMSKPALSQMLRSLEKKDYLVRNIDVSDRRKITVAMTPKGCDVMHRMDEHLDAMLDGIIRQMGEEDARQLIFLLTRLIDILQSQPCETSQKGEGSF